MKVLLTIIFCLFFSFGYCQTKESYDTVRVIALVTDLNKLNTPYEIMSVEGYRVTFKVVLKGVNKTVFEETHYLDRFKKELPKHYVIWIVKEL